MGEKAKCQYEHNEGKEDSRKKAKLETWLKFRWEDELIASQAGFRVVIVNGAGKNLRRNE